MLRYYKAPYCLLGAGAEGGTPVLQCGIQDATLLLSHLDKQDAAWQRSVGAACQELHRLLVGEPLRPPCWCRPEEYLYLYYLVMRLAGTLVVLPNLLVTGAASLGIALMAAILKVYSGIGSSRELHRLLVGDPQRMSDSEETSLKFHHPYATIPGPPEHHTVQGHTHCK